MRAKRVRSIKAIVIRECGGIKYYSKRMLRRAKKDWHIRRAKKCS